MFQKIREIDERITIFLTAVAWWIDVHFNKDNIWCSKIFFHIFPVAFFFCTGDFNDAYQKKFLFELVLIDIFMSGVTFFLLMLAWRMLYEFDEKGKLILKQSQKQPNPNKYEATVVVRKIVFLGMWMYTTLKYQEFLFPCAFLSFTLSVYFLCVERIPPREKEKRKAQNEVEKMIPRET